VCAEVGEEGDLVKEVRSARFDLALQDLEPKVTSQDGLACFALRLVLQVQTVELLPVRVVQAGRFSGAEQGPACASEWLSVARATAARTTELQPQPCA
jgi:hypothetical protein